jgi:hypothetical protein
MFGKRTGGSVGAPATVSRVASVSAVNEPPKSPPAAPTPVQTERRSETYFQTKSLIFGALIEAIDLAALSKLDVDCSGVGLAQEGLHFGQRLFDWIEIWRVGGQEKELGFGGADGGANGAALMAAEVVHDDNVARRGWARQPARHKRESLRH